MQLIAHVRFSELVTRTYTVLAGEGNQFVYWVAQNACLQFGQEHYPHGIYVPTLLTLADGNIPHARSYVKTEF